MKFKVPKWTPDKKGDTASKELSNIKKSKSKQKKQQKQLKKVNAKISNNVNNVKIADAVSREIVVPSKNIKRNKIKAQKRNLSTQSDSNPSTTKKSTNNSNEKFVTNLKIGNEKKNDVKTNIKSMNKVNKNQEKKQKTDIIANISKNKNNKSNASKTKGTNKVIKNKKKTINNVQEKLQLILKEDDQVWKVTKNNKKNQQSLRAQMVDKLKSARFRFINEEMYTKEGKEAKKFFENDPEAFEAYHDGYKQQVSKWPINPLDIIIQSIKKMPKSHNIADMGCGEGKLAKSVPNNVHSFDLVAVNNSVIVCDMSHVPLENNSMDVVVFCLSLMGTNLRDYLFEGARILKIGGFMKIVEVKSRFDSVDAFIKIVERFGFSKVNKNLSHNMFCFLDFKKRRNIKKKNGLPIVTLNPCLYKKR